MEQAGALKCGLLPHQLLKSKKCSILQTLMIEIL
jgi:hypothetical protein